MIEVLENEYLNPFSISIDPELLVNLSSGCSKEEDVDELLNIWTNGKALSDEFSAQRILSKKKPFHDPIPRNKIPTFQTPLMKISSSKKTNVIEANRNIIAKLLSISTKYKRPIDFEDALRYPLFSVPLNLAYPDGSKRETQKSKLLEVILPDVQEFRRIDLDRDHAAFIIDLIAQIIICAMAQIIICAMSGTGTLKEFINKLLLSFPKGFKQVHVIADTYRTTSIKNQERIH